MSEATATKPPVKIGAVQRVELSPIIPEENTDENNTLTDDEKANVEKGLNPDGTSKAAPAATLTDEEKQANIAKGLNEDGTSKAPVLTDEIKAANIAKGLNEDGTPKTVTLTDTEKQANIAKGLNEDGTPKVKDVSTLTKEEIKALYEKEFPTTAALTEEEKKKAEQAFEKRMLDWFVEKGGTVDKFSAMKLLVSADLNKLAEAKLEAELTEAGFTEEEKKIIRQERYFQFEDTEIEALTDEQEKALAKKKKEFGTKKLSGKATYEQKLAVDFFDTIKKALKEEDADAADEKELAQKVDSHFQTVPGKITVQMGKTKENVDIAPLELDVDPKIIAEVRDSLKDTATRNKILQTEDGSLNIAALSEILIRNKVLEAAANRSYLKGVSDNTAEFEKTFPIRDANALNIGNLNGSSNSAKVKGKQPASFGKPQRVTLAAPTT